MRRLLIPTVCLLVLGFTVSAHAGALSQLYPGVENVIEDNDWENFVDNVIGPQGPGFLDVGDYAYGIFETTRVNNVVTAEFRNLGQAPLPGSFAGVFMLEVAQVLAPLSPGNPTLSWIINWKPAPAAAWTANLGVTPVSTNPAGANDTIALVLDDTSTPIVNAGHLGGLAASIATATDGVKLWEFGFAGGPNESWTSISNSNIAGAGLVTLSWLANLNVTQMFPAAAGWPLLLTNRFFDLADDGLANNSSGVFGQLQVDGAIDLAISGPEAVNWSIKTDTDFVINPVPEPGSLALLGLGLLGLGGVVYRRRRK